MKSKKPPRLQFVPTNLTTEVGTASYNPRTGEVSTDLNDQLEVIRDYFWDDAMNFGATPEQQQFAENVGIFGRNRFNNAMQLDTNKLTTDYYDQVIKNLQPSRALEDARMGDQMFRTGRTGYATGYLGGGYINPEQFNMLKAREEANANLLLQAEDRARNIQNQEITAAGQALNFANALRLQPYQNVAGIADLGIGISNQATNLLAPLSTFSQQQLAWQNAKQQNDAQRAAASGGGFFGGLGGGLLSSASQVLGQGLGNWASTSIFGQSPLQQYLSGMQYNDRIAGTGMLQY